MRNSLFLCAILVLLAACVNNDDGTDVRDGSLIVVGDAVPAFSLTRADAGSSSAGKTEVFSSEMLKGRAYILSFFDTGCPDCQRELPVLQRVYDRYGSSVPVFNVPRSQTVAQVQDYWHSEGLTMPFHTATDPKLYYSFATTGIPRTYIVDADGKVSAVLTDNPLASYETLDSLLRTVVPASATRADSVTVSVRLKVPPTESGAGDYFQNEYMVSRLDMFFFDVETGELIARTTEEDPVKLITGSSSSYDATYLIPQERVHVGKYNIYAVANYVVPDAVFEASASDLAPTDQTDESTFLALVDSVTYRSGVEASIPAPGCVMTSDPKAFRDIDLTPYAGKDYYLTIELERVVAKVQIGVAQSSFELSHDGMKYADLNITNYKLVNLNRAYYLFQHTDGDYIVDPYFYDKLGTSAAAAPFATRYTSWYGTFSTENFASMPTPGNYGYAYILENTSHAGSQKNGYSTGIVFKAAVSPAVVYIYDNATRTLQAEYRPEYWPDDIYLWNYRFYGSIQAINTIGELGLDELTAYSDAELRPYGIKQCKFNMGVYETYYTYWIQHQRDDLQHMMPMEYAIVRNHFYRITITGISGIGDSEINPDVLRDNYPNSYADINID